MPPSRVATHLVAHQVVRHGEQPRALVRQALLAQRAQKRLLRQLLRAVAIPQLAREKAHQLRVVLAKQPLQFRVVHAITSSPRFVAAPRR